MLTDEQLEDAFRESLERHAAEAHTEMAFRNNQSRRSRVTAPLAAAAVTVLIVGGVVVARYSDRPGESPAAQPSPTAANIPQPTRDWRVESWGPVQVSVPSGWGWGGAPQKVAGRILACGAAAFRSPTGRGELNGDPSLPYVGRPLAMTDLCSSYPDGDWPTPTAPYVWLGASVEPGVVDLGDGWTQETEVVAGEPVTVATQDASLRQQILDSAKPAVPGDATCAPTLARSPEPVYSREGLSNPSSMTVCAYMRGGGSVDDGSITLTYATRVGSVAAQRFLDALQESHAAKAEASCTHPADEFEWVVLRIPGKDALNYGYVADLIVHLGDCAFIEGPEDAPVVPRTVSPWAVDGIPSYVVGPYGDRGATAQFFRGILG